MALSDKGIIFMNTLRNLSIATVALAAASIPTLANAQSTGTVADLGSAVDFGDVKPVLITVALAVIGVGVLIFGIMKVKGMITSR